MSNNKGKIKVCSAHKFHVMKEREKKNYLNQIGEDGCNLLFSNQIDELESELKKRSVIFAKHINHLKSQKDGFRNLFADEMLSKYKWTNKKMDYPCISKKQNSIFQFDIFNCELGVNIGFEKNKTRPVLILSKNPHLGNTVLVAPITTTKIKNGIPVRYTKNSKVRGYIDLSHLRTVDKNRLTHRFIDRLLSEDECKSIEEEKNIEIKPLQQLIRKKISQLV